MKYLLLLTTLISFNGVMADNHGSDRAIWLAKLKLDLAKLKGPPLLVDLEAKRTNRIADLDLLINSGIYEGKKLDRLISMRENVLNTELPSQEQINLRHEKRIKTMDRKLKDPMMRDRKRMQNRKQKNRRNRKD
tara:strand:+ start:439 stop:840 length:402 start_codon:yes stop_codon:yes gene_type:complete